jgi:hypothetical protein
MNPAFSPLRMLCIDHLLRPMHNSNWPTICAEGADSRNPFLLHLSVLCWWMLSPGGTKVWWGTNDWLERPHVSVALASDASAVVDAIMKLLVQSPANQTKKQHAADDSKKSPRDQPEEQGTDKVSKQQKL